MGRHSPRRTTSRGVVVSRTRLLAAAIAACYAAAPVWAQQLPTNPIVTNGAATFAQSGKTLTVTNTNGAAIKWDSFNIGAGYTTHFAQSSASSSVLNRVVSADPSLIYGTLSSNGRVWLINPAGIVVGPGGRVDTAGFVASTLDVSYQNFLAGRLSFQNTPGAGKVLNQGTITTPTGGAVYLVGADVGNEGIITTPGGETILAAGQTVDLIDTATPGVKVEITGAAGNVTNLGEVVATAGRIGMAGVIVKNAGTLNASSVVSEGGRVFLKASKDAYVDGAGRIVSTGKTGGRVEVLGQRVAVTEQAEIDVSGANGGGTVLVGGDWQGKSPTVPNAQISYFGPQAAIRADATQDGAGGKVVVWADDTTRAYGYISAQGAAGGKNGMVETSGRRYLDVSGIKVRTGTWLLDPYDLTVSATATNAVYAGGIFASGTGGSDVYYGDIVAQINSGTSVVLQTSGALGDGYGGGDIAINAAIAKTAGSDAALTLKAHRSIVINAPITSSSNKLDVTLQAHYASDTDPGNVAIKADIDTNGGNLVVGGGTDPTATAAIGYATGSADQRYGIYLNNATISTHGGNITMRGRGIDNAGSGKDADGIDLWDDTVSLQAGGGDILLIGRSGDNPGSASSGVYVAGTVETSGAGTVTISGTGGLGGGVSDYNSYLRGIRIEGGTVRTADGAILLTGYGGNVGNTTGYRNYGVMIDYWDSTRPALVESTGTGNVTIWGQGGGGDYTNRGVYLQYSTVRVHDGNLALTGYGGNAVGDGNKGVVIDWYNSTHGSQIAATGAGAISITGYGGCAFAGCTPTYNNDGVALWRYSTIQSAGGSINIVGTGSGSGSGYSGSDSQNANTGIYVQGTVSSSASYGAGAITLTGRGGSGAGGSTSYGVSLDSGAVITTTSSTADVSVTAYGDIGLSNTTISGGNSLELLAYGGGAATGNVSIKGSSISGVNRFLTVAGWDGTALSTVSVVADTTHGNVSIADSAISAQTIDWTASGDLTLGATNQTVGVLLEATATDEPLAGHAPMFLKANNIYAYGSTAAGAYGGSATLGIPNYYGAGVIVRSSGGQQIYADDTINLRAGSVDSATYRGSAVYGGSVVLAANGYQEVRAKTISLYGGASGHDNAALISAYGDQVITAAYGGVGGIAIYGGGSTDSYDNAAGIRHGGWGGAASNGSGNLTITLATAGSHLSLYGGQGSGYGGIVEPSCNPSCQTSSNRALIANDVGNLTVAFSGTGNRLNIVGGGVVGDYGFNNAGIESNGDLTIGSVAARPDITLTGGSAGGRQGTDYNGQPDRIDNGAFIGSKAGAVRIYGGTVSLAGGSATVGGAFIGASDITLSTSGNLDVSSGSYGGDKAMIGSSQGTANINVSVYGNATLTANGADVAIGSRAPTGYGGASVVLTAGGDITLTGVPSGAGVYVGAADDTAGSVDVLIVAGRNLTAAGTAVIGAQTQSETHDGSVNVWAGSAYTAANGVTPARLAGTATGGNLSFSNGANIKTYGGDIAGGAAYGSVANGDVTFEKMAATGWGSTGNLYFVAGWNGTAQDYGTTTGYQPVTGFGSLQVLTAQLDVTGDVVLRAGDTLKFGVSANPANWYGGTSVTGGGTMTLAADNQIILTGGNTAAQYLNKPIVNVRSSGMQTVTASGSGSGSQGAVILQGGTANSGTSGYGGGVALISYDGQSINAKSIAVYGGTGGHDNGARIESMGAQTLNVYGGTLYLAGGSDSGGVANYGSAAKIIQTGASDSQTINIYYGGSLLMYGGSGTGTGGGNVALIRNSGNSQSIDFHGTSQGRLTLYGGSAGIDNGAMIDGNYGSQWIGNSYGGGPAPIIGLYGGSGGGAADHENGARIEINKAADAATTQTVYAGSIVIDGGAASYGGAGFGAPAQKIYATGDVTLTGGSGAGYDAGKPGSAAYIGNEYGASVTLDIGGNLTLRGGTGSGGVALIGSLKGAASVDLRAGGNVTIYGGSGTTGAGVAIGSAADLAQNQYGGDTTVTIASGGNIGLTAGSSANSGIFIGSYNDSTYSSTYDVDGNLIEAFGNGPTKVSLFSLRDIAATGNTGGVFIGVKNPTGAVGSSVNLWAGTAPVCGAAASCSAAASGYGGDIALTDSHVRAGGNAASAISLRTYVGSAAYGDIGIVDAVVESSGNLSVGAARHVSLTGVSRGAVIDSRTGMSVTVGGDLNLTGSTSSTAYGNNASGDPLLGAGAFLRNLNSGSQTVDVTGKIVMTAGAVNNATSGSMIYGGSAAILNWAAGADQTVSAGSIAMYGGSGGHDNLAAISAQGRQEVNINGGQLYMQGGSGAGSYNNAARIDQNSSGFNQTVRVYGGGSILMYGGAGTGTGGWNGGGSNGAGIANNGGTSGDTQTIDFYSSARGTLTLYGGTAGIGNGAGISAQYGSLVIGNSYGGLAPNIGLFGGSGGGGVDHENSASIDIKDGSSGSLTITAHHITIAGGTATYGGAGFGGPQLNIQATGDVAMTGGSSASFDTVTGIPGSAAYMGAEYGANVTLDVGGNLTVQGGAGYGGMVLIGALKEQGAVAITVGDNISLSGGSVGKVVVGSMASSTYGATVSMLAGRNLGVYGGGASVAIGAQSGSKSDHVWLGAGAAADVNTASGYGGSITTTGNVRIGSVGDTALKVYAAATPMTGVGSIDLGSGSTIYGEGINILAASDVAVGGNVTASGPSGLTIQAGNGSASSRGASGGSITLTGNSISGYGGVQLDAYAYGGSGGGITQTTGSLGSAYGDVTLRAEGNISSQGSIAGANVYADNQSAPTHGRTITINQVSATGTVTINASGAILDHNATGTANITAPTIALHSQYGGISGGKAITTDSYGGNHISAVVGSNATYGGIRIDNVGSTAPSSVSLTDYTANNTGTVHFGHGGSLNLDGSMAFAGYGDIAILSGGNLSYSGASISSSHGSVLLDATGDLSIVSQLGTSGDLSLSATGNISNQGLISGANVYMDNRSASVHGRTITLNQVSATGEVSVLASGAIVDGNGTGTANITAPKITLRSLYGGSVGVKAISTDTVGGTDIWAKVDGYGSYGGIRIDNVGSNMPTALWLADLTSNTTGTLHFSQDGSDLSLGNGMVFAAAGDMAISTSGNMNYYGATITSSAYGSVLLGAEGNLAVNSALSMSATDIGLVAGGVLDINRQVYGDFVTIVAPTVNINGSGAQSGHIDAQNDITIIAPTAFTMVGGDVYSNYGKISVTTQSMALSANAYVESGTGTTINAASVTGDGAGIYAYTGDVDITLSGDLRWNNGSIIEAGNDVNLVFTGTSSRLYLNDAATYSYPSYILADKPTTVNMRFVNRPTADGVVINGETTTTSLSGRSGLFVLNHATPATRAAGLSLTYENLVAPAVAPPSDVIASVNDSTTTKPTGDDGPAKGGGDQLQPLSGGSAGNQQTLLGNGSQTIGGGSGQFADSEARSGSNSPASGSSATDDTGSSGDAAKATTPSGDTTTQSATSSDETKSTTADKENGKDTKDKKDDKKSADSSGDKKDDKASSGKKPLGRCNAAA